MEELDNEAKLMAKNMTKDISEIDTEMINTTRIKSKVNPEKEMILNPGGYFRTHRREMFLTSCNCK